ncbi:MAG: LacI family DNA-binding transcriptional regulator [Lentisphaeria bacterium]|nr:LacI family DNA-binding transcriptional regulator [Lentisphaeria bacterium]
MSSEMDIKSFAKAVGVSCATVSRAFGGRGRISQETKKKILDAAEELGYYASFHARNLGKKHGGCIAFFYPELYTEEPDYFISEIVLGVNRTLRRDRIFNVTAFDEDDERLLSEAKEQILDGRVSGAIIISGTPGAAALADLAFKNRIPCVVIGRSGENSVNTIDYDNGYGATLAGKYFRETGRKHPAYVSGHLDRPKKQGFARGFGVDESEVYEIRGGAGFQYGSHAAEEIFRNRRNIDCILCANDIIAIGFIKRATELGIKIPQDIGVIGFDDIAISKNYIPSLSTVSLHLHRLGVEAGKMIEQLFDGKKNLPNTVVRCDLIIRESS